MGNAKRINIGEFFIVLAALLVASLGSAYLPLLLVAVPLPAIYAWQRFGVGAGLAFTVLSVLLPCLVFSWLWALLGIPVVLVSCVCGIAIKKRARPFLSIACACGGAMVGLGAIMGAVALMTGTDFLSAVTSQLLGYAEESFAGSAILYAMVGSMEVAQGNMSAIVFLQNLATWSHEQMAAYVTEPAGVDALRAVLANSLPSLGVSYAVASGLLGYLAPRALAKRRGCSVAPIPSFGGFILPRSVAPYFVISFILGEVALLAQWTQLYFAAYALLAVTQWAFSIQGLSLIYWFLLPKVKSKGICWLIVILVGIFFLSIVMWVGLLEQLIRIRERQRN